MSSTTDAPVNLKAARMAREQARWIRCWDKAGKPFAFGVPSQTQPGLYHLTNTRRCDCASFRFNGDCTHRQAVRIVVKAAKLRKGIAA